MAARVLVTYASKLGSNAEIAETLSAELRAAGHHVTACATRDVREFEAWDAVVLGSAIYAAHWQRDARRFIARFSAELAERPLWLWGSGPLDARLAAANLPLTAHGAELTAGLGALGHRTFGGRLAPDAPIDPQVLRTHPIGDFRDWDDVRAYAREIAAALDELPVPAGTAGEGAE